MSILSSFLARKYIVICSVVVLLLLLHCFIAFINCSDGRVQTTTNKNLRSTTKFHFFVLIPKNYCPIWAKMAGWHHQFFCQCSSKANKASYNICNIDKYCYIVNIFWLISVCLIFASFAVLSENQTWCVINYRQFESETNTLRGGLKN